MTTDGSEPLVDGVVTSQANPLIEAHRMLSSSVYSELRLLRCEYQEGAVVIHGQVPSFYYKQLAQAMLMANPHIDVVVNQVEVL